MKYITIKDAAKQQKCALNNIYVAIRTGKLKCTHIPYEGDNSHTFREYVMVTTQEWLDTWDAHKRQKEHQFWNGKPMYDATKGEMNSRQAAEYLGLNKNKFMCCVYSGRIKYTRKGSYYVFDFEDVKALQEWLCDREERKVA